MKTITKVPSQERFRAQCTGIGQTRQASESTGMRRSQCVIDCAPKDQRKLAIGYPTPTPDAYSLCPPGQMRYQKTLR